MNKYKLTFSAFIYAENIEKIPSGEIMRNLSSCLDSYSRNDYLHRNLSYMLEEVKE